MDATPPPRSSAGAYETATKLLLAEHDFDVEIDLNDTSSQHSIDSTSSSRKRYRASPDDHHLVPFVEPSKDVATQKQKLSMKLSDGMDENLRSNSSTSPVGGGYEQWVHEHFGSIPWAIETRMKARQDGEDFKCIQFSPSSGSTAIVVRHAKIHRSVLGWIESCSAAMIDPEDGNIIPSTFEGHERIALKVFDLRKVHSMPSKENALNELRIHAKLSQHPRENVSQLLACFRTRDHLFAVFPMYEKGDLFEYLAMLESSHRRLPEQDSRYIMKAATKALQSCHEQGICHRDVSLENFCLRQTNNHKFEPVLIDFGVAAEMITLSNGLVAHTGPVGKAKYMAPELLRPKCEMSQYDGRKCDVFSLGVALLIMTIQREPWDTTSASDVCFNKMVLEGELELVLRIWGIPVSASLLSLLKGMLNPDPDQRLSLEEVMQHAWLNQ